MAGSLRQLHLDELLGTRRSPSKAKGASSCQSMYQASRPKSTSHIVFPVGENLSLKVVVLTVFVFKLSSNTDRITRLVLTLVILEHVLECQEGQALTCTLIPPIRSTLSLCGQRLQVHPLVQAQANSRCACACFAVKSGCSLTTGAFDLWLGCFAHGCGCNHVPAFGHHVPAYLSDDMRLIDQT